MNAAFSYPTSVLSSLFNPRKIEQDKQILRQLVADLDVVQNRLGTDQERTDDCELARDLGHQIRNKLHIVSLWASLGFIEMPPEIKRLIRRVRRTEFNSVPPTPATVATAKAA
jgi:hypothetical protein